MPSPWCSRWFHDLADTVTRSLHPHRRHRRRRHHRRAGARVAGPGRAHPGRPAKFVKRYADLRSSLTQAVTDWADEVVAGTYPDAEHQYS